MLVLQDTAVACGNSRQSTEMAPDTSVPHLFDDQQDAMDAEAALSRLLRSDVDADRGPPSPLVRDFYSEVESRLPGRVRDLSVDLQDDGSCVLRGRCTSYYVKQVAQHIGMTLLCCGRLTNQIQVYPPR